MATGRVGIRPYSGGTSTTTTTTAVSIDTDAQTFITATAITDTTQINAVNNLVLDLKAAGVWTKMKALYPMVGGTATTHKFNLKDPRDLDAAYRLVFSGGWTHTSTGALPNGTTGYADTSLIPSTAGVGQNSIHFSYYSRTDNNVGYDMAAQYQVGDPALSYFSIRNSGNIYSRFNNIGTEDTTSNSNGTGMYTLSRISSTGYSILKNTSKTAKTVSSTGLPIRSVTLGALYQAAWYYGSKECAFASIGDGLTDLESNLFYQIVEKYQYALGRNVNANQTFYFNRNYSNETNAFIFNGAISDATQQSAINTLVNDLKAAGIWTKMKAVYPMVGGTALAHKFNLLNPIDSTSTYTLSFSGGWTHTSTGALPNGTTGYANTFLTPSTALTLYNNHISFYSRTNTNTGGGNDIGAQWNQTSPQLIYTMYQFNGDNLDGKSYCSISTADANRIIYAQTTPASFVVTSRTANNSLKSYTNGVLKGTNTTVNTSIYNGLPQNKIVISAFNYYNGSTNSILNYSNKECAFASIGDGLTDLESNLFYQIVEKFQYALGRNINTSQPFYYNSSYTNETNAFIFNGAISDATQQSAINTLVNDLKAAGIWTKMKALYPMVGGTALAHKFNLLNPIDSTSAYALSFNGGGTHDANGYQPNGSNAYANTSLIPSSILTLNNAHLSYYSRTNRVVSEQEIGSGDNRTNFPTLVLECCSPSTRYGAYFSYNGGTLIDSPKGNSSNSDGRGFYIGSRTTSTSAKFIKNGIILGTNTTTSSGVQPNYSIFIGGQNYLGTLYAPTLKQCAFSSIGDGLTDLESTIFYQIVEKFQYALGRNVNTALPFYYNSNYSNETNAFIVNGSISDATQISAVDTLVKDLKSAGIWTKISALYPFVGGTAQAHKFNLINPIDADSAYRLAFNGGGTHSSIGYQTNGSNAYANTFLTPSVGLSGKLSNTHLSYYTNNNTPGGSMGSVVLQTGVDYFWTAIWTETNLFYPMVNSPSSNGQAINYNPGRYNGLLMGNRVNSTQHQGWVNKTKTTLTKSAGQLNTASIYLGCVNFNGSLISVSNNTYSFASIGDGLTDLESGTLYQIVEKFQYTLGRNINATLPFYYNNVYGIEANAYILENSVTNYSTLPVTSGLIMAYDAGMTSSYPGSGTAIYDISSNSYTGTFYNGPVFNSSYGGNIVFDGTNDYIYSGAFPSVANNFTIDIWCRPVANSTLQIYSQTTSGFNPPYLSNHRFILSPDNLGNGTGISIGSNGINVIEHGASTFPAPLVHYTTISSTLFTNITIVYTNKVPSLYINGVFVKTGVATTAATTYCSFSQIGGMAYGYFAGALSSIKWYSKSLSATEITQNYNVSKSRYGLS